MPQRTFQGPQDRRWQRVQLAIVLAVCLASVAATLAVTTSGIG